MAELNHKTVVAGLDPQLRKKLLERSDSAGLFQACRHLGLIALSSAYIYNRLIWWPIMLPVQGMLLIFLFTAQHECIHGTAFKSRWLNTGLAHFCGLVNFLPSQWFRQFHFTHHRYTNDPDKDPELSSPRPATLYSYVKYLSGAPVWSFQLKGLLNNALGTNRDGFIPGNYRREVKLEARAYLLVYLLLLLMCIYYDSTALLWIWIVPVLIGQPFLRAYLLAEHALCPQVNNVLANTRTTLTNWFVRFIAWNMPYHAEHHTLPSVPFHQLPVFHRYLESHLNVIENGYARFHKKMLKAVREL